MSSVALARGYDPGQLTSAAVSYQPFFLTTVFEDVGPGEVNVYLNCFREDHRGNVGVMDTHLTAIFTPTRY